jgi:hypothetical protein
MEDAIIALLSTEQMCAAKHKFTSELCDLDGKVLYSGILLKHFTDLARPESLISSITHQLRAQGVLMVVRDSLISAPLDDKMNPSKRKKNPFVHFVCQTCDKSAAESPPISTMTEGGTPALNCTKARASNSTKATSCPFSFRLAYVQKQTCWGVTELVTRHEGHFPRLHLPSILCEDETAELATMRNTHGVSTSALLSKLRAEGKILTSQQILNALNKYTNAKHPGISESSKLLHTMCDDDETVFVLRFNVISRTGDSRGSVNFLRVPGFAKWFSLSNEQLYQECGNTTHFVPCAQRPCVLDRYFAPVFNSLVF